MALRRATAKSSAHVDLIADQVQVISNFTSSSHSTGQRLSLESHCLQLQDAVGKKRERGNVNVTVCRCPLIARDEFPWPAWPTEFGGIMKGQMCADQSSQEHEHAKMSNDIPHADILLGKLRWIILPLH